MTKQELNQYRECLLANYERSSQILIRKGYERIASVMAGEDSGSLWMNPKTRESAEIKVRNMNLIDYK